MTNYTILLPPSEGKESGGNEEKPFRVTQNLKKYNSKKYLEIERDFIYDSLRRSLSVLREAELEKVFDVKGNNLDEAVELLSDLLNQPTLLAIERFSGVMFKAIDYQSLPEKDQQRFNDSVLFIDGMYGLLAPQDLIPNYKLKIAAKFLDVNVTKYWKERLVGPLGAELKDKVVIDILPEAHRKVIYTNKAKEVYQVMFATMKNGRLSNVAHNSKKLKGELIRYLVQHDILSREELESFSHTEGYSYSKEYSTDDLIVYFKS